MKRIIYILGAAVIITASSCQKKFEEYQVNPNVPTSVPPNILFNTLINGTASGLGGIEPWGAVMRYNQFYCRNYQYGDNQYNWNNAAL